MKIAKKILLLLVVSILVVSLSISLFSCSKKDEINGDLKKEDADFVVGICQLVPHEALDAATKGFYTELREQLKKEGKTVYFDYQNASGDSANCATIAAKFVAGNYDLIMANATPALQACAEATKTIPVLGTSVTDYATAFDIKNWTGVVGGNVSGTSDCAPLDKQAAMIIELVPNATKVGILYCSAESNSKYQADKVEEYLKALKSTLEVKTYTFADTNEVTAVVNGLANEVDALYIPTDNTCAANAETIEAILAPKNVPVIAGEEGIAKKCGIATLSISYSDLGKATGEMAAKILLKKADISTMEVAYASATTYMYVESRCTACNITVPSNYIKLA